MLDQDQRLRARRASGVPAPALPVPLAIGAGVGVPAGGAGRRPPGAGSRRLDAPTRWRHRPTGGDVTSPVRAATAVVTLASWVCAAALLGALLLCVVTGRAARMRRVVVLVALSTGALALLTLAGLALTTSGGEPARAATASALVRLAALAALGGFLTDLVDRQARGWRVALGVAFGRAARRRPGRRPGRPRRRAGRGGAARRVPHVLGGAGRDVRRVPGRGGALGHGAVDVLDAAIRRHRDRGSGRAGPGARGDRWPRRCGATGSRRPPGGGRGRGARRGDARTRAGGGAQHPAPGEDARGAPGGAACRHGHAPDADRCATAESRPRTRHGAAPGAPARAARARARPGADPACLG